MISRAGGPTKIGFTIGKVGFTITPHDHAGSHDGGDLLSQLATDFGAIVCGDCHLCAGSDDRSTIRPQCWQSASPGNRVLFADGWHDRHARGPTRNNSALDNEIQRADSSTITLRHAGASQRITYQGPVDARGWRVTY